MLLKIKIICKWSQRFESETSNLKTTPVHQRNLSETVLLSHQHSLASADRLLIQSIHILKGTVNVSVKNPKFFRKEFRIVEGYG